MARRLGIAAVILVAAQSITLPEPANATDWKEYMMICVTTKAVTVTDKTKTITSEVFEKPEPLKFVQTVNKYIEAGWQPLSFGLPGFSWGCQTMVRK